jgi:hypothetical protein
MWRRPRCHERVVDGDHVRWRSYNECMPRKNRSLPPGIDTAQLLADARSMSAAVLIQVAPAASTRILADVSALAAPERAPKEPALERLEQAIGRDFADRLVAALSEPESDALRR